VELQRRLALKRRDTDGRTRVAATLTALLESRSELTRRVAADALFLDLREPGVRLSLTTALGREKAPAVKAALLRQLCYGPTAETERTAIALLGLPSAEAVRSQAVNCLGRGPPSEKAVNALRAALRSDTSPAVRGDACAALGALGVAAAIPDMARMLEVADVGSRCAAALAALGSAPAYAALESGLTEGLKRGRVPTQIVSALASLADRPFFVRHTVAPLFSRVVADRRLSWVARKRAASTLHHLDQRAKLRLLRRQYRDALDEGDGYVREEIDRLLADEP
jgi:HEAT repeat protein